ncbi:MAG TPA: sigma-70 family RNA polymerase sigma factor [Planctomycetaceae bacterium]|jgi:RNA polymerase sigma factor (sigma-70 family)|nr:sigma-70 family RNA polymerase sigma factor [Planctomycetaceae bacterium]
MARSQPKRHRPPPISTARREDCLKASQPLCPDANTLWCAVQQHGPERDGAIEVLARLYDRIAAFWVNYYAGRGIDREELRGAATQALRMAVTKCDPDKIATFPAFAKRLVQHAVVDLFRDGAYGTRHQHDQNSKFEAAKERLAHDLGRQPTADETYSSLCWSDTERSNHLAADAQRRMVRIDHPVRQTDNKQIHLIDQVQTSTDFWGLSAQLAAAIPRLDPLTQQVLKARYYGPDHPSQQAVAESMGLTEYKVRRIEDDAILTLRRILEDEESATRGSVADD